MKIKFICSSCGTEMEMNKREWLKHFKKFHPTKVNCKEISFNGYIQYEN